MEGMGIVAWIIIGVVAGWLAEKIMGRSHGLITNLIFGIIGAIIGGWLTSFTGFPVIVNAFVTSIIVATLGAVILLYLLGLVKRR